MCVCVYVCMCICVYVYMCVCVYVCMCVCVYVCMCVCVYVCMCVCVYVYVYVYVYVCKGCQINFEYKFAFVEHGQNKTSDVPIEAAAPLVRLGPAYQEPTPASHSARHHMGSLIWYDFCVHIFPRPSPIIVIVCFCSYS